MTDHETLIREALAEEASHAVDSATVLNALRQGRRPRRRPVLMIAAAGVAALAAVLAVIVPLSLSRDAGNSSAAAPMMAEQNILLIGVDGSANADSVVLARLGADDVLRGVSLPRDSWVDVPGRGMMKLGKAYADARQAAAGRGGDPEAEGAKALVAAVEGLTGVRADHYAALEMSGFARLSEAIGGVEVCLRAPSRDPFSGADFPAGRQSVSGPSALAFVRQRHGLPSGDLDRIVRQQAFLRGVAAAVAGGRVDPLRLGGAVDSLDIHVDEGWDVVAAARRLAQGGPARLATIPVSDRQTMVPEVGAVIGVDPATVRTFVGDFLSGAATSEPGQSGAGENSPAPAGEPDCVN